MVLYLGLNNVKPVMETPSELVVVLSRLRHKAVKHPMLLLVGFAIFGILIYFTNEHVTAGIVLARVFDAFGDVAVDRAIVTEL